MFVLPELQHPVLFPQLDKGSPVDEAVQDGGLSHSPIDAVRVEQYVAPYGSRPYAVLLQKADYGLDG